MPWVLRRSCSLRQTPYSVHAVESHVNAWPQPLKMRLPPHLRGWASPPKSSRGLQKAHFEYIQALAATWFQEASRRLILSTFTPWLPNDFRRLPESNFKHFRTLVTKWPQEVSRKLILSIGRCGARFGGSRLWAGGSRFCAWDIMF